MSNNFIESQKFTQWWLWILLIGVGMIPIFGIYEQIIQNRIFGENPMSDSGLLLFALLIFTVIGSFFIIRLETIINDQGITMRFIPFVYREIQWKHIKSIQLIKHTSISSGIRISLKYGTIYKVKGKFGILIELEGGEKFLIGTQKADEVENLIKNLPVIKKALTSL